MSSKELKNQSKAFTKETGIKISSVENTYDGLFATLNELDHTDIIVRTNCKMCTHPYRRETERRFEEIGRNYTLTFKFIKDWEQSNPQSAPVNFSNVRTHMQSHYLKQERQIWLREYSRDLKAMMDYKVDQDRKFEMLGAALELKLHEIAADPTIDIIRQADAMTKLVKSMLELTITQAKLRGEMQAVNIVIEKFQHVWFQLVNSQENEDVKRALLDGLDTFQTELQSSILPETPS
jgi:hypothetical protein